jgi:nitrate reductase gamma subunit
MNAAGYFFAVLFYAAMIVMVGGLCLRVVDYWQTPVPLKIPTTPAPMSRAGVAWRMAREVLLFDSLFRANLWTWAAGWLFHVGLALVVIRHLRYFTEPTWAWVVLLQPFGVYGGFLMAAGLLGLWMRRLFVERIRYLSTPSDHLMLALLLGIAGSGLIMKFALHTDIVAVKVYFLGWLRLDWQPLADDALLLAHLSLVAVLAIIFPFSKLLHAPGIFFSPTRNQIDDSREVRHIAAWAKALETKH